MDVDQAFDKAWFDGILYLQKDRGVDCENWLYIKELNKDSYVTVKTCKGETKKIFIEQVLKQGGVLSPIQFGIMTDEIAEK